MTEISNSAMEGIQKYIRIIMVDENGKQLVRERSDKYGTTVELGYEDLLLKEDSAKISLYQTSQFIEFFDGIEYEVVKRSFMPCTPVSLYIYLKKLD
jgi:hypothetical protein